MNKVVGAAGVILLAATGSAFASGYRIPEQSVNSTARSAAYVAYTPAADAAYYNPANMAWLEDRTYLEANATWIHLSAIEYTDQYNSARSGDSETENFLLPTFFAVSPEYNNFRFGFSVTAPAGLSKQWQDPYPRTFAEEFTLKVFEFNPTVSYAFCDRFSVGAGVRAIYIDGKVKSSGMVARGVTATRDMEGDSWEAGYNVALTARPVEDMNVSLTYRSKVDLGVEGTADLYTSVGPGRYSGDTGVEIPLPAMLAIAVSYTFFDQLTVELDYDRTYWSDYENLDFTYPGPMINPVLAMAFDSAKPKQWSDTESWRLSVSYDMQNDFILMAGFAIDENPVPDATLSFELPDSDALLYSVGLRYKVNQDVELGVAYLYDDKESRNVYNDTVQGTVDGAAAHLLTVGLSYKL
jgi:long-chain fatty acid transport protein